MVNFARLAEFGFVSTSIAKAFGAAVGWPAAAVFVVSCFAGDAETAVWWDNGGAAAWAVEEVACAGVAKVIGGAVAEGSIGEVEEFGAWWFGA